MSYQFKNLNFLTHYSLYISVCSSTKLFALRQTLLTLIDQKKNMTPIFSLFRLCLSHFPMLQRCRVLIIIPMRCHSPVVGVVICTCSIWSFPICHVRGSNLPLDEHEGKVAKHKCIRHTDNSYPVGPVYFAVPNFVYTSVRAADRPNFGTIPSNGMY